LTTNIPETGMLAKLSTLPPVSRYLIIAAVALGFVGSIATIAYLTSPETEVVEDNFVPMAESSPALSPVDSAKSERREAASFGGQPAAPSTAADLNNPASTAMPEKASPAAAAPKTAPKVTNSKSKKPAVSNSRSAGKGGKKASAAAKKTGKSKLVKAKKGAPPPKKKKNKT
jgi:hypothetical protein